MIDVFLLYYALRPIFRAEKVRKDCLFSSFLGPGALLIQIPQSGVLVSIFIRVGVFL